MKRRDVLKKGILSLFTLLNANLLSSADKSQYKSAAGDRDSLLIDEVDILICGGGPAGVAAAISAARKGLNVRLIELHGYLGGVMTAGLMTYFLDQEGKKGIIEEIINTLTRSGTQLDPQTFDPEQMKYILEQMCIDAGVNLLYHTRVIGAECHSGKITSVITESGSGRQLWKAKVYIDCTGNGDLAALAGCRFNIGHPDTGSVQAASMGILVSGIDYNDMLKHNLMVHASISYSNQAKINLRNEIEKAGIVPSYTMPVLTPIRNDLYNLSFNHQYNFNPLNAQNVTDATIAGRKEVHDIINSLRKHGGIWKNIHIVASSGQIGIRESRRIQGMYTISKEDLLKGARFEDAVVRASFPVDIHYGEKSKGGAYDDANLKVQPYDIPVRCLISKDIDNLMMAGRCISGDYFAHASYRVLGNAIPMGEGAGRFASESIKKGKALKQMILTNKGIKK